MTRKETNKVLENCQTFHSRLSAIRGKVSDHVLAMGKVCSKVQENANARPEVPGVLEFSFSASSYSVPRACTSAQRVCDASVLQVCSHAAKPCDVSKTVVHHQAFP